MESLLVFSTILILICGCGFISNMQGADVHIRKKRSLIQLGMMIDCTVLKHDFIDYNGYGCWCGIGGTGTPLDATDRCCHTHDHCYDNLHAPGEPCIFPQIYTAFYLRFKCNNCDDMSAYNKWWFKLFLTTPECRRRLCECDAAAVRCLREAESTFNPNYRYYYKRITGCESLRQWIPQPMILDSQRQEIDNSLPSTLNENDENLVKISPTDPRESQPETERTNIDTMDSDGQELSNNEIL